MNAYEYIESVQQRRDALAHDAKQFRASLRDQGIEAREYNNIVWYNYIYNAPKSLSVDSLRRQIFETAYNGSRSVNQVASISGYPHIHDDDDISNRIEADRKHAHLLLDVLIAKLSEQNSHNSHEGLVQ